MTHPARKVCEHKQSKVRRGKNPPLTFTLIQLLYKLNSLYHHFFLFGFWGFFSCCFFFFLNVCLSFKIGLWGLLLYLSRLWGQMHEFQLPHQECIKHWMRMGGTNQIMWAELEFILICYIPSPNWRRKNGRVSIGTRGYKCDDWISLRQFLH